MKHQTCEACGYNGLINILITETETAPYRLCPNCLIMLVNNSLTPDLYFKLREKRWIEDRGDYEFYLHGDFYNLETGEAIQSKL